MIGLPANLRIVNQRLVFQRVLRGGAASRAEVARATGLSVPTVGKAADRLVAAGWLEEGDAGDGAEEGKAGLGRPAKRLRLAAGRVRFVAVQLGVRHTRVAALPVAGPVDERWAVEFATPGSPGSARLPGSAGRWRAALARAAGKLGRVGRPWAVVVALPGAVDEAAGRVLLSPNLHWTEGADLCAAVRSVWRSPVFLVQETRALALGQRGAEAAGEDFLLVDFGEGVGGAAVIGGRLFQPRLALAGELGHSPVRCGSKSARDTRLWRERRCGCGGSGCMETLLSRKGLVKTLALATRRSANWAVLAKRVEARGVEAWLAESLDAAGGVIAGAMNVMGVRRVVVTGSVVELGDAVVKELGAAIRRRAMWARFGSVECVAAPRRWAAGLVAAGLERVLPGLPGERGMGAWS